MTAGFPTGGAPTAGSSASAGSGDLLVAGSSSAIFYNGASYTSAVLFSAGGSGASFTGSGHAASVINVGFVEWAALSDIITPPAARMVYRVGLFDTLFSDGLTVSDANSVKQRISMIQGVEFGGVGTYVWTPGANIVEGFRVTSMAVAGVYMTVAMTEALRVVHRQVLSLLAAINEHMVLTPVAEAYLGTLFLQRLMVGDQAQATLKYKITMTQALQMASIFQRFAGAFIMDSVVVGEQFSARLQAVAEIAEFLALAVDQRYAMAFRLSVRDGLNFADDTILHMIYRQSMTEIIDLDMLFQAPNGAITAWAMNTRTGAVTEYQNFAFNSFVQIGNKYVAASKDGLYELNGSQDDGIPVIADIVGAFLQPAGQHLAGLKGVYLGQTGQGYWLLKIDTGDGREYVYQRLSNPGLMTTKFTVGKGINARYIGWELINVEGQDFDLDTIEFVPMIRTRRI